MRAVLKRNYPVANINWSSAAVTGTNLARIDFPQALMGISNIQEKLENFKYLRAGVKIEVKINTTPFHYGLLQVSWLPACIELGNQFRYQHWQQRSMNNALELSAQSQSTLTFMIPWRAPVAYMEHHEPTLRDNFIGSMWIDVVTPLKSSAAAPTLDLTLFVFASFVDPEVAGPIQPTLFPMAVHPFSKPRKTYTAIGQGKHKKKVHEEAEEKSMKGTLSGVAEAVATVGALLTPVPVVGEIAAPAAMIAGMAAPILKMMNLSKPTQVSAPLHRTLALSHDIAHGKGLDMSTKLAIDPEAIMSVDDRILGDETCQPSLSEIIRVPLLLKVLNFDSASVIGSPQTVIDFTPLQYAQYTSPGLTTCYVYSHLAYISSMFAYWRGSIKIYVKFITSNFTSARFRLCTFFKDVPVDCEQDAGDYPSAIIDVKGERDFSCTIPYLHRTIWCPTPISPTNPGRCPSIATVTLSLMGKIAVPDTSSDTTIQAVVWVAAGEDFQLAKFQGLRDGPKPQYLTIAAHEAEQKKLRSKSETSISSPPKITNNKVAAANWLAIAPENGGFRAEGQSMKERFTVQFDPIVPGTQFIAEHGMISIEVLNSFVELCKRYSYLGNGIPSASAWIVNPWNNQHTPSRDFTLKQLSALFMFWKGSMRYKFMFTGSVTNPIYVNLNSVPEDTVQNVGSAGISYSDVRYNPTIQVEVPWYDIVPYRPFFDGSYNYFTRSEAGLYVTGLTCWAFQAVGEDFCVGTLTAPPIVIL